LTTFFLAFFTTGFGAGCVLATAGAACSEAASGAGAGAGAASGAVAATGAGSAAGSCLVAQADNASAEMIRAADMEKLGIFDMVFSSEAVDEMRFSRNPPIVGGVAQTLGAVYTQ
jgi:hypothetical protein